MLEKRYRCTHPCNTGRVSAISEVPLIFTSVAAVIHPSPSAARSSYQCLAMVDRAPPMALVAFADAGIRACTYVYPSVPLMAILTRLRTSTTAVNANDLNRRQA